MNKELADIIATGLTKGIFDLFNAMLGLSINHTEQGAKMLDTSKLREFLEEYSIILGGKLPKKMGAAAMLLKEKDALQLAAQMMDDESIEKLDVIPDDILGTLDEIASSSIGSGMTNLLEQFGRNIEQLDGTLTVREGLGSYNELMELLGEQQWYALVSFSAAPTLAAESVLLFSDVLGYLDPNAPDMVTSENTASDLQGYSEKDSRLSMDEVSDILQGLDPEEDFGESSRKNAPDNLDMVLDIRLTAIARLGQVEMPISDVLNLGPGSILDIAHMVDEPVDLLVNGKLIARGDVVVVDEKFGLRITEIISPKERIESLR